MITRSSFAAVLLAPALVACSAAAEGGTTPIVFAADNAPALS